MGKNLRKIRARQRLTVGKTGFWKVLRDSGGSTGDSVQIS